MTFLFCFVCFVLENISHIHHACKIDFKVTGERLYDTCSDRYINYWNQNKCMTLLLAVEVITPSS